LWTLKETISLQLKGATRQSFLRKKLFCQRFSRSQSTESAFSSRLLVHAKPLSQRNNREHLTSQVDHPIHECRGMWHASEILHPNNFLHPQNVEYELLLSDHEALNL